MSFRGAIAMAAALMSGAMLGVEARGAEMLTLPGMDLGATIRELSGTTNSSTTTSSEPTSSSSSTTEEEDDARKTESTTEEVKELAKAVITGTVAMEVENKEVFCADTAALEAIAKVIKTNSGADESKVTCADESRRLGAGSLRRLAESVSLEYEIVVYAADADTTIAENSPAVLAVMTALEALDADTLQTLVETEFAAAGINVTVTVTALSTPETTIVDPNEDTTEEPDDETTTTEKSSPSPTDATTRPVAAWSLLVAGAALFAFQM